MSAVKMFNQSGKRSASMIIEHYRTYQQRANAREYMRGMILNLNVRVLRMLEGTFLLFPCVFCNDLYCSQRHNMDYRF